MNIEIRFFLSCFLAAYLVPVSESARILGLFLSPSKSHLIIHSAIANALAEKGHNVTVVSTHKCIHKNPLYRYIQLDTPGFSQKAFSQLITNPPPLHKRFTAVLDMVNGYFNSSFNQPEMKRLMAEESFDLVLLGYFFNDFLLGVPAHFKCPVVLSFMIRSVPNLNAMVGNPDDESYVGIDQPMGFFSRVGKFLVVNVLEKTLLKHLVAWYQSYYYYKNFPSDKYPSFKDVKKNVSLILTNHHFSQGPIRPDVPALVEIGGIQIKEKPDPLPEDIKSILDNSTEHGAIYFSLGSNVQGGNLNSKKVKAIFNVLSKLPQTILWKWDDSEFPGISPNIFYKSWLPQDDILPHPNVRLFLTHGGQGSVVESSYHGVPMLGIPLFADQSSNMEAVIKQGFGLKVEYTDLTEETLSETINEVLFNGKYKENVQKFSKLYKDRPMTAKETAVFWVEYVLRHHGAPHMQSPAVHLNYFQLMSLDVIGFLLACCYVAYKVSRITFLFVLSKVSRKKQKRE